MAADGAYYWVMALITPIDGGLLSIRLKPSGKLFETVRQVYKQMRQIEADIEASATDKEDIGAARRRAMDASAEHLQSALRSLGLRDYDDLMQRILLDEVGSRKRAITGKSQLTAAAR